MKASRRAATLALVATAVAGGSALAQSPAAPDFGSATGEVTALVIGWADQDGIDATTGKPTVGIGKLEQL